MYINNSVIKINQPSRSNVYLNINQSKMNQFTKRFSLTLLLLFVVSSITVAQVSENSELFQTLKSNDSLLFERSFNHCETEWLNILVSEDFEFYHDISGISSSKQEFIKVMKNGICNPKNETKSRRELVSGSLTVFPLKNNGILYGALQMGEHRFFESYKGQPEVGGSLAKFTHLWILENKKWQLKRVLSYNHKMPNK